MFLNIFLKCRSKCIVIACVITIVVLILSVLLMITKVNKIQNGTIVKNKEDLSFTNYYVQYDMTVISNKNINTYSIKEWHKEGVITKLEYLDYMKNIVTVTLENNTCNISNSGNTAKLVINNMYENRNIASLSTFAYLYNNSCGSCECDIKQHVKDDETILTITFKANCACDCSKIANELGISELKLILVDGIPKNYTILDKNKKEYISIVYNIFEKNIEI